MRGEARDAGVEHFHEPGWLAFSDHVSEVCSRKFQCSNIGDLQILGNVALRDVSINGGSAWI